jgi:hypothetical protein
MLRRYGPVAIPLLLGFAIKLTNVANQLIGYALFGVAFVWIVVLVPVVSARLPTLAWERRPPGTGFAIAYRPPAGSGKRRLREDTRSLVRDIWTYVKEQPQESPWAWRDLGRRSDAAKDDDEKRAIWDEYNAAEQQRYFRQQQELSERFGGRLRLIVDDYQRRGYLTDQDVDLLMWQSHSIHWISWSAAPKLEALALRL